jgi:hypothetical protein
MPFFFAADYGFDHATWILHPEQVAALRDITRAYQNYGIAFIRAEKSHVLGSRLNWANLKRSPTKFSWELNADQAKAVYKKQTEGIDVQAAIDAL